MEESHTINITYETLFDILRAEKEKNELQKLDPSFFQHVVDYLKEKLSILEGREGQSELFSAEERRKTRIQLENIQKILKELYERREKKIVNLALDKSKTKSSLIDTSALLKEEYSLFNLLVFLYNIVPGNDLGLAIIALTVIIKLLLYPLASQSIRSQKALQELQPKMDEIKRKLKNEEEKGGEGNIRDAEFKEKK